MLTRIALVSSLMVAGAGLALADSSSDKGVPAGALSLSQVTSRVQTDGFKVSKIEVDDGKYKVKGVDRAGHKQKLTVDPMTGGTISKSDDD